MRNRINILDDLTVNKIAAGEVVERPASAVKELIENSIDAGATRIIVEVQDAGKKLIRITDNGCGIRSDEAEKAFVRHATSKITGIDDLDTVISLGFRGEALSSILSVSRLQLVTKTAEEKVGTKLVYSSGRIQAKESVGTVNGTTIIVEDLFFNIPARKKFLKSDRSEILQISDIINRFSIGYPDVRFEYVVNKKETFSSPGNGDVMSCIRAVHGKEVSGNLIGVDFDAAGMKIRGYVSNTSLYRNNRALQYIYVNKRSARNNAVSNAIQDAYKSIIPINKNPICFLNISADPKRVDVNIHPAKLEVKFQNEQDLYRDLRTALEQLLLGSDMIPKYSCETKTEEHKAFEKNERTPSAKLESAHEQRRDTSGACAIKEEIALAERALGSTGNENPSRPVPAMETSCTDESQLSFSMSEQLQDMKKELKMQPKTEAASKKIQTERVNEDEAGFVMGSKDAPKNRIAEFGIVGTVLGTYIVAQLGKSMFMIDQHAAHERILFEKYLAEFKRQDISSQILLEPIVMNLSLTDMETVAGNIDFFRSFGFDIEQYGTSSMIVRSVPNMFGNPESERFVYELIDEIGSKTQRCDFKLDRIASNACRSAIKAHDRLDRIEIKQLLKDLSTCENPFTCPHGRPVIVELTEIEIEKMFKRIV